MAARLSSGLALLPAGLAARAEAIEPHELVAEIGSAALLLVRIEHAGGELERGLLEAAGQPTFAPGASATLGYGTSVHELPGSGPPAPRSAPARLSPAALLTMLHRGRHFVVPLRKRPGASAYSSKISVGRAKNSDVVLRDPTVSKFHAWFEATDAVGGLALGGGRSTNTTTLDGAPVTPGLHPVQPGSQVGFGAVACVVCPTLLLWEALLLA